MTESIRLGDVVTIERGVTYKSALLGQPGPVLLGLGTIKRHGGFRSDSLRTYGGESPEKLLVRPGQLYASLKDVTQTADLLGAVAMVPADGPTGRLTQDTVRLDLKSSSVDVTYLYWILRTPQYRSYCRSHATGTTTMGLPREDFFAFEFPAPDASRRCVVDLLEAMDAKIAANEEAIAAADGLAEALTKKAFSGTVLPLKQAAFVTMGSSPPGSSYNEASAGLPFYQGVRDFGLRFPSRRIWTDDPVRRASPGDTLLSVRAPVGRTNLANEEMCIGRGLAALQSKNGRAMTLFHQVRAARAAWAPYEAEGTVFGAINRAQLEAIELPAVQPVEESELERRLVELESFIDAALHENAALGNTRDGLVPLLMPGKVRVKDVEESLGKVL